MTKSRGWGLLALLLGSIAQADESPTPWTLIQSASGAMAMTQLESGEQFGLLCAPDRDDCAFFLKPAWACEPGKSVLVRLEGDQGILRLGPQCTETALGPVALFGEDLAGFVRGSPAFEVSLVSPGKERVTLHFANQGAAAAIEQARVAHAAHPAD